MSDAEHGLRWREDHEAECENGHIVVPLSLRAATVLMRTGHCPKCGAPVDLEYAERRTVVYVDSSEEDER